MISRFVSGLGVPPLILVNLTALLLSRVIYYDNVKLTKPNI